MFDFHVLSATSHNSEIVGSITTDARWRKLTLVRNPNIQLQLSILRANRASSCRSAVVVPPSPRPGVTFCRFEEPMKDGPTPFPKALGLLVIGLVR
jgi:hypothetical protein